jgi:predicted GNAT family acetyltransferase
MHLTRHLTPHTFLARSQADLERAEAENNLILGISTRLRDQPGRTVAPPYLATVEDVDGLAAAAVMTPPHRVIIHSARGEHPAPLRLILHDLLTGGWRVPGVVGPAAAGLTFAELWRAATGRSFRLSRHERVYELRAVTPPPRPAGFMRLAVETDGELASEWSFCFWRELGVAGTGEDARASAGPRIANRELYLWDDGGPVSMAGKARPTAHGMAVSLVYTPPERRNRGYASALVAALSQHLLDAGWQFCVLFTDLANPISNSIYQRIGYRPVSDFDEYDFDHEPH